MPLRNGTYVAGGPGLISPDSRYSAESSMRAVGQGRAADLGEVDLEDRLGNAGLSRRPPGHADFDPVALAVIERQSVDAVPAGTRPIKRRRRVDPAGEENKAFCRHAVRPSLIIIEEGRRFFNGDRVKSSNIMSLSKRVTGGGEMLALIRIFIGGIGICRSEPVRERERAWFGKRSFSEARSEVERIFRAGNPRGDEWLSRPVRIPGPDGMRETFSRSGAAGPAVGLAERHHGVDDLLDASAEPSCRANASTNSRGRARAAASRNRA